jgi:hypothetical protein
MPRPTGWAESTARHFPLRSAWRGHCPAGAQARYDLGRGCVGPLIGSGGVGRPESSMPIVTVQYRFRQRFPYSADRAFRWCVDYDPADPTREGLQGRRSVLRLADDAVLLKDTFHSRGSASVTKTKLVRIRARDRSWTSTHVSGPNRYSQFWYRIIPDSRSSCHLDYAGLHLERRTRRPTPAQLRRLAARLSREDSAGWKSLARAMETELPQFTRGD